MMLYYSRVGSYDGAVKLRGRWVRVVGLNRIDKTGWHRVSGPPSLRIAMAMAEQPAVQAKEIFPELIKKGA